MFQTLEEAQQTGIRQKWDRIGKENTFPLVLPSTQLNNVSPNYFDIRLSDPLLRR